IAAGAELFGAYYGSCHSNFVPSPVPDLRRSPMIRVAGPFASVVSSGALQTRGLPAWVDLLTTQKVELIRAPVLATAREAWGAQQAGESPAAATPAASEGHL